MANGTTTQQRLTQPVAAQRTHSKLFQIIAISILTLIILVGLAVLITWLVIKPKQLQYSIEDGSVNNFNLKHDHLNASFDFVIRAHNPNERISIYYDSIEVSVIYDDQTIAFNTIEPFHQPRWNITQLEAKIEARDAASSKGLSKDLWQWHEKSSGKIQLDVTVHARIRFKVGILKIRHKHLSVLCPSVIVHFASSKISQRTYCDIEY